METPIIAALIAALVTIIGWIVANLFTKKREDQARKSQAALRHLEHQIEELYGPLEGLLAYSDIVFQLEQTRKKLRPPEQADKDGMVIQYFIENHYIPINQQIITLLRTKAYLMVGDKIPESFVQFMAHAANLECFHNLWRNTKLHSFFMPVPERNWANLFRSEVSQTLQDLRYRHAELIRDITGRKLLEKGKGD
jgi:hypothetical protein